MEKPEIIRKQIEELSKQLVESEKFHSFKHIDSNYEKDMIGFLNIGKARKIFTLLHDGRELRYIHPSYGEAMVSMNPQKNISN